jgi:hypothetical protein
MEMRVRKTRMKHATSPKNATCDWKVDSYTPKNLRAELTRFPGGLDWTPLIESAPSNPMIATPIRSSNARIIWIRKVTATLVFSLFSSRPKALDTIED